jgi:hypothetical protein
VNRLPVTIGHGDCGLLIIIDRYKVDHSPDQVMMLGTIPAPNIITPKMQFRAPAVVALAPAIASWAMVTEALNLPPNSARLPYQVVLSRHVP